MSFRPSIQASTLEAWEPVFAGLGDALRKGGRGRLALVAPFIPTVRGTRAHLDEIW